MFSISRIGICYTMGCVWGIGFNIIVNNALFGNGTNRIYSDIEYRNAVVSSMSSLVAGGIVGVFIGNRMWLHKSGLL